jgi:hypothetical protein
MRDTRPQKEESRYQTTLHIWRVEGFPELLWDVKNTHYLTVNCLLDYEFKNYSYWIV